jgi:3'-phosphoadenosine 5'-phosphosulfate sulfotransferase
MCIRIGEIVNSLQIIRATVKIRIILCNSVKNYQKNVHILLKFDHGFMEQCP